MGMGSRGAPKGGYLYNWGVGNWPSQVRHCPLALCCYLDKIDNTACSLGKWKICAKKKQLTAREPGPKKKRAKKMKL